MVPELSAGPEKDGVETALRFFGEHVGDSMARQNLDPHRLDARDLLAESLPRQAIRGHAVSHHPAGFFGAIPDLDFVPEPAQVVGAGQTGRAGTDHEDTFAGRTAGRDRPAFFECEIAE